MSIHPVALGAAAAAAAAALITEQCRPAGGSTPILPPHAASPLSDHRNRHEPGWTECQSIVDRGSQVKSLAPLQAGRGSMGKKATPSEKIRKEGEMADIALPNSESGSEGASSTGSSTAVRV